MVLIENYFEPAGCYFAMDLPIDLEHRRQGAASQAGYLLQVKTPIGGGLAGNDPNLSFKMSRNTGPPCTWQAVPRQTLIEFLPGGVNRN